MSIPGSASPLLLASTAAAASGYQISRSLRFNSADSAYLSRTPAVAGNRRIFTWAGWIKRSTLSTSQNIFGGPLAGGYPNANLLITNDNLRFVDTGPGGDMVTTAVYRDTSAWMHVVLAVNYTILQAKMYVNGAEITSFSANLPFSNADSVINASGVVHTIGQNSGALYLDAYLADVHFIDGQALTPSSFTEVSATTGQLIPKAYSGTFGTNGFWLKFSDNSAATAATLGNDYSGNNNDWTPNNLSVTAGAGNDSLVDTPTSYGTDTGVGGNVRGNYCTLNPVGLGGGTLSNGNLDLSTSTTTAAVGTVAMKTGKWYWEITCNTVANPRIGVFNIGASSPTGLGNDANGWCLLNSPSRTFTSASSTSYGTFSPVNGTIVNVAYDADAGKLWFGQDGNYFASGNPATGANASMSSVTGSAIVPALANGAAGTDAYSANFGQRAFAYTAPSGFKALCDTNLGAPVVAKPNTLMDVALYTGNGAANTITGLAFSPDLVWIKSRSLGLYHFLIDTVRGNTKTLSSNTTDNEAFATETVINSFDSSGFTLNADDGFGYYGWNVSGTSQVAWTWDAGTSTVSNTAGSITSQVRANVSAGFSVVTFTYPSSGSITVGHGLGVAPSFIITKHKNRSSDWAVYHASIGKDNWLSINTTGAAISAANFWGTSAVSSTTFGGATGTSGISGDQDVAYCFAPVVGYSSMGSYVGNGSADGPFVYTGFRPRWIMIKWTTATEWWWIFDTARDTYNASGLYLGANAPNAEQDLRGTYPIDILSNGFKIRNATFPNGSQTAIYAAFAESPFQYARAR